MKLIDENYQGFDINNAEDMMRYYFEYDVKAADFFLKMNNMWDVVESNAIWYTLKIGDYPVKLPSNAYIMLADLYSVTVDWVRVDELHGRNLSTALYYSDLAADKWSFESISLESVDEDPSPAIFPNTKNILPVLVGGDRMVFVSVRDCYVKTKKMNFACLY